MAQPARPLRTFYVVAFAWSWAIGLPLALASHGIGPALPPVLHLLIAFGPLLGALAATLRHEGGRSAAKSFLALRLGSSGGRWLAVGGVVPLLFLVAAGIAGGLRAGGLVPAWNGTMWLGLGVVPATLVYTLTFGVGEEAGWRGFALPRLIARHGPVGATLRLFALWASWHLPLILDRGAIGAGGPFGLAQFFAGLFAGAFVQTWLAVQAQPSVWPCALLHGAINGCGGSVDDPLVAALVAALLAVWAIALLVRAERSFAGMPSPAADALLVPS